MFDPNQIQSFKFLSAGYLAGTIRLRYGFDDTWVFSETITFPESPEVLDAEQTSALDNALVLLHLISGVSYFKAAVPQILDLGALKIDPALADFFNQLYVQGLAEFAYNNELNLQNHSLFTPSSVAPLTPVLLPEVQTSLLAMGGGKDSLVSLSLIQEQCKRFSLISIGQSRLIQQVVDHCSCHHIQIQRKICPNLIKINSDGAYNGHVPVTAINSAILLCAAIVYGYDSIVFSNERSANSPNIRSESGIDINHQYSKSFAFEQSFASIIHSHVSPSIQYFSLLRPLSELAIIQRFSKLTQYHSVFSSCNRNFHIDGRSVNRRWCGHCPKCLFVYLGFAVFMDKSALFEIFSQDVLYKAENQSGLRELLGLGGHKPFECVGEIEESQAAMLLLSTKNEWQDLPLLREFNAAILPSINNPEGMVARHFKASSEHNIPDDFAALLTSDEIDGFSNK